MNVTITGIWDGERYVAELPNVLRDAVRAARTGDPPPDPGAQRAGDPPPDHG